MENTQLTTTLPRSYKIRNPDDYRAIIAREILRETASAVGIINALVREAYEQHASDLHVDPGSDSLTVRLRIDGVLHDAHQIPMRLHGEILARIKILTGLRTDEHQMPQDGRFSFDLSSTQAIDVRVSIVPTYYGENVVLRLLTSNTKLLNLSSLGLSTTHQELLKRSIAQPHGLILITGATGSGKTSTLYTLLRLLNTRTTSLICIEDPIEYALEGITQIPANDHGGLSFEKGLRSILRQDPNIIGIGEIRDNETASLAAQAALTGHQVFSTLHTSDAASTIPRLIDMGVEPYLIASTLCLAINQRLLRKLCTSCRATKPLSDSQKKLISEICGSLNSDLMQHRYESAGCVECKGSGKSGRIGVFEIMPITAGIRAGIIRKASASELFEIAVSDGMTPLLLDALRKAAEGVVDLDDALALANTNP